MLAGINRANEYFKNGDLIIFKNCVNTIREVENWKWKKLKPGIQKNEPDEPIGKDDHICADIRYLMNSIPRKTELKREPIVEYHSAEYFKRELVRQKEYVH